MAGRISYLGGIVTQGLVLDLDAAKRDSYAGTGTAWNDISGNRNNGTLVNGPTFNSGNGGSIVFDGTNDYVNIVSNNNVLSSDFSVNQWYRPTTNSGGYRILFETNGYRNGNLGIAIYQFNNYFRFWRRTGVNTYLELITTSNNSVGLNVWKMLTLIRSNGIFNFYVDNILLGTYSSDNNNYSDTSYHIGGDGPPTSLYWYQGNIAQISFYNRALSTSEILQNYNATKGRYL